MKTVGVIGYGSIGQRHAKNLRKLGAEVTVYDLSSDAVATARRDGFEAVEVYVPTISYEIKHDACVIATPPKYHIGQLLVCLDEGVKAVLVEKPLAVGLNETKLLRGVPGRNVLVGYNLRYVKELCSLCEIIFSKQYGAIQHVEICCSSDLRTWRKTDSTRGYAADPVGGGVLLDISHEIDYMRWLFGMPQSVCASLQKTNRLNMPTEDIADMLFKYDGFDVAMHLDYYGPMRRYCRVQFEQECVEYNLNIDTTDTYKFEVKDLLCCVDGMSSPIPLQDGIDVIRIIAAIKDANAEAKFVEVAKSG